MSPDARLIALAVLYAAPDCLDAQTATDRLTALMNRLPQPEPAPGIRGMVPVAYLKDVIEGFIARLGAARLEEHGGVNQDNVLDALNYAKRRLADVEAL